MLITSRLLFCLLTTIASTVAYSQEIIPKPQQAIAHAGIFTIGSATEIVADRSFADEATFLQKEIRRISGIKISVANQENSKAKQILIRKTALNKGPEAYHLSVNPSAIIIEANEPAGAFYGCISLLQLMPFTGNGSTHNIDISAVDIMDAPRFKWRGLMLDVSRTFMSPAYVRKTIDRMAFYKMNILHLHLTDDQGWRSPVKSYPLLNKKASRFDSSYNEPDVFQGYYTEKDVKELVQYAAQRHVELVPEIESPGHSHDALFAYPSLLCKYEVSPIMPFRNFEPTINDVFCVSNPKSLQFFGAVINETAALFPSGYFHLGGDEVPRKYWDACPRCQALVKSLPLKNTSELQGHFMQQLHDSVVKAGKRPVAWDEILHDNNFLTKDWIIMSWRGSKPGWDAAAKGFDVVMTPTSHMYFDYEYEATNTKKIFGYDPLEGCPDTTNVSKHILGIQANFWSHIDRTESKVDYQLFPRVLALAERAWSSESNKDFEDFRQRRNYHRGWLEMMNVKYFTSDFK